MAVCMGYSAGLYCIELCAKQIEWLCVWDILLGYTVLSCVQSKFNGCVYGIFCWVILY